ncbi:MAG: large conductance mechanosensitive channel protein MscL [Kineosporiaceae bacterium]|nr:large conductance mechanosensitive channel protein MscL [Kineosporiaceae bacterium]MBK7622945.1 large conductance mechanosensitive channel protein MscL [Kineosporiaceae bacterium]MBK8075118.1 large conductance mechanosensitive channel protein MscL [Kineosporiaceae bacterium]
MIKGFKEFLMRGNVVDLAVAVVIGGAFGKVVEGLLNGLINPLIAAVFGSPNLDSVGTFKINGAAFSIGVLLTALVNFVIIAGAIYFFVVTPMQKIMERANRNKEAAVAETPADVALLTEIRDLLRTNR